MASRSAPSRRPQRATAGGFGGANKYAEFLNGNGLQTFELGDDQVGASPPCAQRRGLVQARPGDLPWPASASPGRIIALGKAASPRQPVLKRRASPHPPRPRAPQNAQNQLPAARVDLNKLSERLLTPAVAALLCRVHWGVPPARAWSRMRAALASDRAVKRNSALQDATRHRARRPPPASARLPLAAARAVAGCTTV